MKLPAPAGNAPAETPIPSTDSPSNDLEFGDNSINQKNPPAPSDDKPFDDEPFDAGVEADEETDPKKFIEQLTGKLGQSLRKYNEEQGQPDFELEKFAINSLLSATHTAEMDEEDKNDIIKKVNTSGDNDSEDSDMGSNNDEPSNGNDNGNGDNNDIDNSIDANDERNLEEIQVLENEKNLFIRPKKNSMFAPEGSPEFMEQNRIPETDGLWANIHAKRKRGEKPAKPSDKDYPDKKQWDKLTKEGKEVYFDEYGSVDELNEGKYDDKPLNKPMKGDIKKFKVYVKNDKGNVIKVNFGDPNMEIKRDNPERKKSFRARHNCDEAKDKTTPKYWSCKMWSNTPVSKLVEKKLTNTEKMFIIDKKAIKAKLQETFNQDDMIQPAEPVTKPVTKPTTEPSKPSRRDNPFIIEPDTIPQPDPKASE